MNKLVYSCLSTLETNKILMYEFWYDYIKPKYQYNAKLCYINTGGYTIHNKIMKPIDHCLKEKIKN